MGKTAAKRGKVSVLSHIGAFARWWMFITFLASKNAGERFRFRRSDWGTMLAIFEPLLLVFALGYFRQLLLPSTPAFGSSVILFAATGLLPYYLFIHVSQKIRGLDSARNVPMSTWADNAVAYVLGEVATKSLVMALLFFYLYLTGVPDAIPVNPLGMIAPLLVIATIAFAVGVVNAVIISVFEVWYYIYTITVRALMVFSAVFFVLDFAPLRFRTVAIYNPIAQAITWLRGNFYTNYPVASLDIGYTLTITAIALLLAMLLEDQTRRWRTSR